MSSPSESWKDTKFDRSERLALVAILGGVLITVLDITIVNLALPSIGVDLHVQPNQASLILPAYLVPYGGLLLFMSRCGDRWGRTRIYAVGITAFLFGSIVCAMAPSLAGLIVGRGIQGIGASCIASVSMALVADQFEIVHKRARAFGAYATVAALAGVVGVVLGGVLIDWLGWRAIFWINVPIGGAVLWAMAAIRPTSSSSTTIRFEFWAASAISVAFAATILLLDPPTSLTRSNQVLMTSLAVVGFTVFMWRQATSPQPLVPRTLMGHPSHWAAGSAMALWNGARLSWLLLGASYLQTTVQMTATRAALWFVPANITVALVSLYASSRFSRRLGPGTASAVGLLMAAIGLVGMGQTAIEWVPWRFILAMVCTGAGSGLAFNPLLQSIMQGVDPDARGAASGMGTTFMILGGSMSFSLILTISRALGSFRGLADDPSSLPVIPGFLVAAAFALLAALLGLLAQRMMDRTSDADGGTTGVVSPSDP